MRRLRAPSGQEPSRSGELAGALQGLPEPNRRSGLAATVLEQACEVRHQGRDEGQRDTGLNGLHRALAPAHAQPLTRGGDCQNTGMAGPGNRAVAEARGASYLKLDQAGATRPGANLRVTPRWRLILGRIGGPLATAGEAEVAIAAALPAFRERHRVAVDAADRHATAAAGPSPGYGCGRHRPLSGLERRRRAWRDFPDGRPGRGPPRFWHR